jgi:hypothetical protein
MNHPYKLPSFSDRLIFMELYALRNLKVKFGTHLNPFIQRSILMVISMKNDYIYFRFYTIRAHLFPSLQVGYIPGNESRRRDSILKVHPDADIS